MACLAVLSGPCRGSLGPRKDRLVTLTVFPAGRKVTDARVTAPPSQLSGPVPAPATEIAQAVFAELGLTGLVLAGTVLASQGWAVARGWADLDRAEALRPAHRFPAWAVTKLVTATAVLRLVAEGQVRNVGDR